MKLLNGQMEESTGETYYTNEDLINPLKRALGMITRIFSKNEAFRRPVSLQKGGQIGTSDTPKKVWIDQNKLSKPIWDCTLACFADDLLLKREDAIINNADAIRAGLIDVMQTDPEFTDSLVLSRLPDRVDKFKSKVKAILDESASVNQQKRVAISFQQRREMIGSAMKSGSKCNVCGQTLGHYEDHLHIDHILPVSKGGTNSFENLQVVHKTCNLKKYNKIL